MSKYFLITVSFIGDKLRTKIMSKSIKVLGTGCAKCQSVTKVVKDAISENNIDATVEKVEDMMEIMKYNVMVTPALVIDGEVKIKGRVPSKDEVLKFLK
ncbi:small redox-active disulfide protein 2 [Balneicella halophila]|uniref:Small redox-active disulfide protein 2 n=2 Tax=Balneicella halophila TaxID=1537566 RepID=A0A7L4US86_BALHA|nr:small redox-active disulfide protein 2 [Balneicella halophila]